MRLSSVKIAIVKEVLEKMEPHKYTNEEMNAVVGLLMLQHDTLQKKDSAKKEGMHLRSGLRLS